MTGLKTANVQLYLGVKSADFNTYYFHGGLLSAGSISNGGPSSNGQFDFDGGTLQATGNDAQYFSGVYPVVQAGGAIIDVQGFNVALGQSLLHDSSLSATPDGGLTKLGSGVLTLTGTNTYTGATTINQGELLVNGWLVSPVTVNSGGILAGTGSLTSVIVNAGGHLAPGDAPGLLNLSGSLTLMSSAVMDYELDTPLDSDKVLMLPTGLLTLSGQQFSDFNWLQPLLLVRLRSFRIACRRFL